MLKGLNQLKWHYDIMTMWGLIIKFILELSKITLGNWCLDWANSFIHPEILYYCCRCIQENTPILEELVELRQRVWEIYSIFTDDIIWYYCRQVINTKTFLFEDGRSSWLSNTCKPHHRGKSSSILCTLRRFFSWYFKRLQIDDGNGFIIYCTVAL